MAHPLEGKIWFRLVKVLYIGLCVIGAGVCSLVATETADLASSLIAGFVVVVVLLGLRRTFYYVLLGRGTPLEPTGTGFADIDDLRADFAATQAKDPDVYAELIEPYFERWKASYGRRVPLHELQALQERTAIEMERIQEQKQEIISNAAREGATIDIEKIREGLQSEGTEGADDAIQLLDELEAKHGPKLPADVAYAFQQELQALIRAQEQKD
jgi:hypothetical protein